MSYNSVNFVAFRGGVYQIFEQYSRGDVLHYTLLPYDSKARKDCESRGAKSISAPAGVPKRITDPQQISPL